MASGFEGFGPKALPFFKALAFHQSKPWFEENRHLYDSDVVAPMVALLEELNGRFAKARLPLKADGKKSIFRIHRDVRFAKDKAPYKTHAGAVMTRSGAKNDAGLLYIHVDPDGSFIAAGVYMPEAADLATIRKSLVRDPKAWKATEAALAKGNLKLGTEWQVSRMPRGFEAEKGGPLDAALRHKSFLVEEDVSPDELARPDFADRVADFAKRSAPLLRFMWKSLGRD